MNRKMSHAMKHFISLAFFSIVFSICGFAQTLPSPGSLYLPGGSLADATRDLRASHVDDVITIVVSESLSGVPPGVPNSSQKSSANSNIPAPAGTVSVPARIASPLGLNGDQELAGSGQTSRAMTLNTVISARVVDVTANGTLVVEGTKDIAVN